MAAIAVLALLAACPRLGTGGTVFASGMWEQWARARLPEYEAGYDG